MFNAPALSDRKVVENLLQELEAVYTKHVNPATLDACAAAFVSLSVDKSLVHTKAVGPALCSPACLFFCFFCDLDRFLRFRSFVCLFVCLFVCCCSCCCCEFGVLAYSMQSAAVESILDQLVGELEQRVEDLPAVRSCISLSLSLSLSLFEWFQFLSDNAQNEEGEPEGEALEAVMCLRRLNALARYAIMLSSPHWVSCVLFASRGQPTVAG
jgi:hypothetical protein